MIVDDAGGLVWFHPVADKAAADFKVGLYKGEPVLTWWEGKSLAGLADGEWVVLDSSYRELARFSAANGRQGDLHEFVITADDTALVTSNETVPWDLTSVGGSRGGLVVGGVVQELSLPGGRLIGDWRSLDHVAVAETEIKSRPGRRFDYFHVNSVDVAADGNLIVSARNTWAAYKVNRQTGRILWRLGGKRSDFTFEDGAAFAYQHDVRRRADGAITLFDNGASQAPQPGKASRALALELDEASHTARVADEWVHRERLLSETQGNHQVLPNGHVFVGWGAQPAFSEFTADGKLVFDGRIGEGNDNYRAYRGTWAGRPATNPALLIDGGKAFASWNGATEVARWQLLAGDRQAALQPAGEAAKQDFETSLQVPAGARFVAVRALGSHGRTLGESQPVAVR